MNPIFIIGPTASGKSAVALELAKRLDAEIAAIDAFQVYRKLNIGTAKPSSEEQRRARHHLIDLVEPLDSFSVADYLKEAERVKTDLIQRKKTSVWVGGTGLYFRALREGLSTAPASEPEVIAELEGIPFEDLVEEVRRVDPEWSAQADLKNPRRVIRALAVYRQTGEKFSVWQSRRSQPLFPAASAFLLQPNLPILRSKIASRVEQMWQAGWPEEVRELTQISGWETSQSAQALGYSKVLDFLKGRLSKEAAVDKISLETGQFAKRQLTWFGSEGKTNVIRLNDNDFQNTEEVAGRLWEKLR